MKTENISTLKIHKLTQAQYDRELAAGNIDENALYLTPNEAIDLSGYATTEQVEQIVANKAPAYTYGTTDKTAGTDTLATGTLYFVYEE